MNPDILHYHVPPIKSYSFLKHLLKCHIL
jgi:hypothetical protein